jgi:glutathione peroxidase
MKSTTLIALVFALVTSAGSAWAADCPSLIDYRMTTLKGVPQDFCAFKGKVILAVNTASYCGYTKQYEGLQALDDKYRDKGLVVVGFPANDFGMQEPGSNAEVADFCERTFKVKFAMMEKSSVVGTKVNPLFANLAKTTGESPRWNFHKYLIGRDGKTVKSFASKVAPDSAELLAEIDAQIGKK